MDTYQIREQLFFRGPHDEIRIHHGTMAQNSNLALRNQRVQMLELMPNKLTTYHTSNSRYL